MSGGCQIHRACGAVGDREFYQCSWAGRSGQGCRLKVRSQWHEGMKVNKSAERDTHHGDRGPFPAQQGLEASLRGRRLGSWRLGRAQ